MKTYPWQGNRAAAQARFRQLMTTPLGSDLNPDQTLLQPSDESIQRIEDLQRSDTPKLLNRRPRDTFNPIVQGLQRIQQDSPLTGLVNPDLLSQPDSPIWPVEPTRPGRSIEY